MAATTLPTLLLGGDPDGDPEETYASWRAGAGAARRARPGRRPDPALPAGRRRRGRRRHRGRRWCTGGRRHERATATSLHRPTGGTRPPDGMGLRWSTPEYGRLGATRACGCWTLAPGESSHVRHRTRTRCSCCRCPASCRRRPCGGDDRRPGRPATSVFSRPSPTSPTCRSTRAVTVTSRGRRPVRAAGGAGDRGGCRSGYEPAGEGAGRAARGRRVLPGRSTTSARRRRSRRTS